MDAVVKRERGLHRLVLLVCVAGCGRLHYEPSRDAQVNAHDGAFDAAFDAPMPDAGSADTGTAGEGAVDGALDASLIDAGTTDANSVDARVLDANVADSAALDAGRDAQPVDAGGDAGPWMQPPCEVDVIWQSEFSADPTQQDQDGDSMPDWIVRGGGAFPSTEINGGVWTSLSPTPLDTNPPRNITTTAYIDVRLRDTRTPAPVSSDYEGTLFWINVDYTATDFAALFVSVARVADEAQEVRFYGKSAQSTTVLLLGPISVNGDFVRVQYDVDPRTSTLNASVNGVPVGSAMFPRLTDLNNDRYATAFAASSASQFDFAQVAVCVP